ncbi:MAG: CHAD domain-containing protein [Asticcacaulis sp.]|nr:CHAD domain-containing protein [Asticcacaulis sp.]
MLLKLEAHSDTAADLHRMVLDELDDILRAAATRDDDRAHRIHLGCKRIRSYLRLLRGVLGDKRYRKENRFFRDFARPFGAVRNQEVANKTVDLLADSLPRAELDALRQLPLPETPSQPMDLNAVMTAVTAAQKRFIASAHGKVRLKGQLRELYRHGRRLYKTARDTPSADNLHEWRKQAKYLRYALAAVEETGPDDAAWRKRLKKLAKVLGEHHDLSLLHDRIAAPNPALAVIYDHQTTIGDQALELGRKLYDRKPRTFIDDLALPGKAIDGAHYIAV